MLKILQVRLQYYMNCVHPDVQAGFRKGRRTSDQIANIHWIIKKPREFQKNILLFCCLRQSLWLCGWITTNCGKFWKRWEYQTTWPASWEIRMQVRKQQLELDLEEQTGFKMGKEYVKAIYCHPVYLTYMQSTSWEMLGWMKQKLESRLPGEISITSDMQMTPPLWQKYFPGGSDGKVSAYNAKDLVSIPGSGRPPGEGNGNPLQYSCLENPMDRGAWWATVPWVARIGHSLATKPP